MKKRKSPILLLTILIVCGGAVAFMNMGPRKADPGAGPPVAAQEMTGEKRETVSRDALAAAPAQPPTSPEGPGVAGPSASTGPLVTTGQQKLSAPAPNESTIRGRWYTEGSYDKAKKAKDGN